MELSSSSSSQESAENTDGSDDYAVSGRTTRQQESFVNDGPLAWMSLYLDLAGVQEGKSIAFGPFPVNIDESKRQPDAIASKLREEAARNLQNIGMDERKRRAMAAKVMGVVTFVYVVWASLVLDDGGYIGHVLRLLSILPLFPAVGFQLSADTGL